MYYLLSLVNEDITGLAPYRLPIPADVRLAVTLRFGSAIPGSAIPGIEITSRGPRKMSFGVRQRSVAKHGIPNDIKEIRWQHFEIDP